jgi:hypothetical protein
MGFSDKALRWVVAAAALFSPLAATYGACTIVPPGGPFTAALAQSPQPPTESSLPNNPGARSTLIAPGPVHRWDAKSGLVDSPDGSLLLHGVASSPGGNAVRLNVLVLVDYMPRPVEIRVWSAERDEHLARVVGAHADVEVEGAATAFDIELPGDSVPAGQYREIQTLVWLEGGPIDARRWTVSSGPEAPATVECIAANASVPEMATRTRLESDGRFLVRAPRSTTLAVVPLLATGPAAARFVRIDEIERGGEFELGAGVELAAVWEAPFTGPGTGWISSFWSALTR